MPGSVQGDRLRMMMRHVPSPVTVVTAAHAGEKRGITIGSFASTSLEPPLISFNVARDAQMYPLMQKADRFVVHVLSESQAHLGNQFSLPDAPPEAQFKGVAHVLNENGTPVLEGAVIVISCLKRAVYEAGDHVIVLGEVVGIEDETSRRPLVYYDRNYHAIGAVADITLFDPAPSAEKSGE